MGKRLTAADIFAAPDIATETVDVPEWGGEVVIKAWSVAEGDKVGKLLLAQQEDGFREGLRQQIVALSIVDEDGNLMFSGEDIARLGQKSPAAMNRVYEAAFKLNKMRGDDEVEEAKND